jgi:pseudouridine kinase
MGKVTCIGGAAVDRKFHARIPIMLETSNPVTSERSFGGVARNVAETLARLGVRSSLVSLIGDDENGRSIVRHLADVGVDTRRIAVSDHCCTAEYVAVLQPDGNLALGLADMAIFDEFSPDLLDRAWPDIASSAWIFADCNLPSDTIGELVARCRRHSIMLAVDAVSTSKAMRLPRDLRGIDALFLNLDEARALLHPDGIGRSPSMHAATTLVERGATRAIVTCGAAGLVAADGSGPKILRSAEAQVVDATGAGDSLIAGTMIGLMQDRPLADAARLGMIAALLTIEHAATVRPDLSLATLESALHRVAVPTSQREAS